MTAVGKELRVLCGETADDLRIIRRWIPEEGFDQKFSIPCPDDTGSQLAYDGQRLHMSQWYRKRVLALGGDGRIERVIDVPHGVCGQVFAKGYLFLATTDAEETTDYWLTRVDLRPATPTAEDLVRIPCRTGPGLRRDTFLDEPPGTKPDRFIRRSYDLDLILDAGMALKIYAYANCDTCRRAVRNGCGRRGSISTNVRFAKPRRRPPSSG